MKYIIALTVIYLIMFLAPFMGAVLYCKKRRGKVLWISQEKRKDARYFGKSFSKMVENNIETIRGNTIKLSKVESFVDGKTLAEKSLGEKTIDNLVICIGGDFIAPHSISDFSKEIYCDHNIILANEKLHLRAAYAKQSMIIGYGATVDRWIDAENTIAVYDNCGLGMSVSAGKRLCIGVGCSFRRMFAPEILIGQYPKQLNAKITESLYDDSFEEKEEYAEKKKSYEAAFKRRYTKMLKKTKNISVVDNEMADDNNEAYITVITNKNLTILENIIVMDDIRSQKSVRLREKSVVLGNIFAEGDIYIGKGAAVLGNIFTQGNIYIEQNAEIGRLGKIVSVIAREKIIIDKNVMVYGFISCEGGGRVALYGDGESWNNNAVSEDNVDLKLFDSFLLYEKHTKQVILDDVDEYEILRERGFRKDNTLDAVEIRVPARLIPRSFCYGCLALVKVECPDSIEEIGAFAFADCKKLKSFTKLSYMKLRVIDTSAFENCIGLEAVEFPKQLEKLGGAAFAGCRNLSVIRFAENTSLREIGDHCFRDCEKINTIYIPDSVEVIGVSAFAGCKSLRQLCIPAKCKEQPGILELLKYKGVEVVIRD